MKTADSATVSTILKYSKEKELYVLLMQVYAIKQTTLYIIVMDRKPCVIYIVVGDADTSEKFFTA